MSKFYIGDIITANFCGRIIKGILTKTHKNGSLELYNSAFFKPKFSNGSIYGYCTVKKSDVINRSCIYFIKKIGLFSFRFFRFRFSIHTKTHPINFEYTYKKAYFIGKYIVEFY